MGPGKLHITEAALGLQPDLIGLVTYDGRLSEAAAGLKLKTFAPK